MKKLYFVLFLFTGLLFKAQTICNTTGNLMLFTNYDGGTLTINVDQNIPNLKIGICSYEGVAIYLTGAFVGNVTAIRYAGFNSFNNHCGSPINTNFNGVPGTAVTTSAVAPAVTLPNSNGYSSIICGYSCSNSTNQGGCNTVDQIEAYFLSYFSGSTLFAHKVQYGCWTGTQSVSIGGNCCPPPPVYPGVIAASQTICAGTTPTGFLSSSSATVVSGTIGYQWESSTTSPLSGFAGIPGAIASTYGPVALTQTTYYRRAASTATNNVVYSNVLTITVLPLPLLSISGNTLACAGSTIALTATGGTSYTWSTGQITASIILTPSVNSILTVCIFLKMVDMFLIN